MKITTNFDYPPIPIRQFDWSAVDDNTYDGEGCKIGHGATEEAAVRDLLTYMWEDEEIDDIEVEFERWKEGKCDQT